MTTGKGEAGTELPVLGSGNRGFLAMVLFGLMAALAGRIQLSMPGLAGGLQDPREIFTLVGLLFVPHWGYTIGIGLLASLGGPFGNGGGLEIAGRDLGEFVITLVSHLVALPLGWYVYHHGLRRIRRPFYLGLAWAGMVLGLYIGVFHLLESFLKPALYPNTPTFLSLYFSYLSQPLEPLLTSIITAFAACLHMANRQAVQERDQHLKAMVSEIQERKNTEKALRQSEERNRILIETMNEGLATLDREGYFTYVNDKMRKILDRRDEEILGHSPQEFLTESGQQLLTREFSRNRKGQRNTFELEWLQTENQPVPTLMSPSAIVDEKGRFNGIFAVITDLREMKALEERVQRADRMESLARLAGGVAHDLNNILASIVSYPDLLILELPEDSPLRLPLQSIKNAGERAAGIVEDLLSLTRRERYRNDLLNLNDVVTDYVESSEFETLQIRYPHVEFQLDLAPDLMAVKGSKIHLDKALMNLVINAFESINNSGQVIIRSSNCYVDHAIEGYETIQEGEYAILEVRDSGCGMDPDEQKRIFEPFFSTKVMGRSGTGLGLSVVWGTAKDHNGFVDLSSVPGRGSAFTLYFPGTREEAMMEPDMLPFLDEWKGRGETVLVVDDVGEQRDLAQKILEVLGYDSRLAESGEAAVEMLREAPADVLLLDMIMEPGMDGCSCYEEALGINPRQKAVITSGYSETDRVRRAMELGASRFVKKPFLIQELGRALRDTLKES